MSRPPSYGGEGHSLIKHDSDCQACPLGKTRAHRNSILDEDKRTCSIGGAGPEDLSKVRLIVISDFPGHYESSAGYPFFDNRDLGEDRVRGLIRPYNAGAMLRFALENMYGLDTYNEVWCTNALKCDPQNNKPIESTHLKPCCNTWLGPELLILDEYCPKAPILIAGQQAFRGIKLLYKKEGQELIQLGFNESRRRRDLRILNHPVIVCDNPARAARSEPRIDTRVNFSPKGWKVTRNERLYPALPGSPVYSFIEDLKFLKKFMK